MSDFQTTRRGLLEGYYTSVVDRFLKNLRPSRPAIILIPGLLGSELVGSMKNWEQLPKEYARKFFETLWGDVSLVLNFPRLALDADLHDSPIGNPADWRVILPDGEFKFDLFGVDLVKSYGPFLEFATEQKWNCMVFAYDWRRSVESNAELLSWTLGYLLSQVKGAKIPRERLSIVGHSMGGLVAKAFLDLVAQGKAGAIDSWPGKVVTLGAPFYGSVMPTLALFKGDEDLNPTGPHADLSIVPVAISTMPGLADVMLLPETQYNDLKSHFGSTLPAYPVMDRKSGAALDLFGSDAFSRYPAAFNLNLKTIKESIQRVVARGTPLPKSVVGAMYNIRSGVDEQTKTGIAWESPKISSTWTPVPGEGTPAPMLFRFGAGDGTVPQWSARLAGVPDSRVIELKDAYKHASLQNHKEVHECLKTIIP